jgi:hypothetical protein
VIERIKALGAVSLRKMDGIEETMKFPLPKGLKLVNRDAHLLNRAGRADSFARRPRALHPPRRPCGSCPAPALGIGAARSGSSSNTCRSAGSFKARGMYNRLLSNPFPPPA